MQRQPWHPADYDLFDITSLQALARGEANDQQQRRALDWIITRAAMTYDEPFVEGKPDASTYLAGRMSVGRQIVKLLKLDPAQMKAKEPKR